MRSNLEPDTTDLGVEVGSIFAKYLFDSDHLHYGYWTPDLAVTAANVGRAQERLAELIRDNIPNGVRTILDVGCGVGRFAEMLLDDGFEVACVSPNRYLTGKAEERLGDRVRIYRSRFEDVETNQTYDLILFGESFQYIHIRPALAKSIELMSADGYLLICDFFNKAAHGTSPIGGGHPLDKFYEYVHEYPLEMVRDLDLTAETAPSLDIVGRLIMELELPVLERIGEYLMVRHPLITKVAKALFGRRLDDLIRRHRDKTSQNFTAFKSYRLLLYRRVGASRVR